MEKSILSKIDENIFSFLPQQKRYNSRDYPEDFEQCKEWLTPAAEQLSGSDNAFQEAFAKELLDCYFSYFREIGLKLKGISFYDRRFWIGMYVLPALQSFGPEGVSAANHFIRLWNETQLKNKMGLVTYEAIVGGFDRGLYSIFFRKKK